MAITQVLRPGRVPGAAAEKAKEDHHQTSQKANILRDVTRILDVDEEAGGQLNIYVWNMLKAVEKLLDKGLRAGPAPYTK